jgi:nucleoside-diphosphate-sugar epimerase
MRVLVTGSEGYIGTVLVSMLIERGHGVAGLDTCFYSDRHFVPGIRRYPLLKKDIRDVEPEDLNGFEAVIHLAALSNDPLGELNPDLTDAINHKASVRLAGMARRVGVTRFLFSSSCSIYGAGQTERLDESAKFNPLTAYARSKVATEMDLRGLATDRFSPVFLRNGTAFGLSPRMRFDLVLNNLTGWGFTTGRVTLLSDGSAWRPLVHIRDIGLSMMAALEAPRERVHNQAFNVGLHEGNYQIRELAKHVARIVPGSVVMFAEKAETDKRNYNVRFDKIHETLGPLFTPSWDVRDGIEEVYQACRITKLTYEEFDSPTYTTIKGLKKMLNERMIDDQLRWRE